MARKKIRNKKDKYIKILNRVSVVVSVVALMLGMVQKMVTTKKRKNV